MRSIKKKGLKVVKLLIDIIRDLVISLAAIFFLALSIIGLFTDQYQISISSGVIAISFVLLEIRNGILNLKK